MKHKCKYCKIIRQIYKQDDDSIMQDWNDQSFPKSLLLLIVGSVILLFCVLIFGLL